MLTRIAPRLHPRRLKVVVLHHPRLYPGPSAGWELDRGFRLRVLTRDSLVLYLRSPQGPVVEDFLSIRPHPGEESFLLIPAPSGQLVEPLRHALDVLKTEQWWPDNVLLMSDWHVKRSFAALKALLPGGLPSLVAWVFQEMPGETPPSRGAGGDSEVGDGLEYFTPEQNLYQFGRISRHVRRRCRWRRWLP